MNLYRNNLTIGDIPQLDVVVPEFFPKTGLVAYYKLDGNSNDAHGSNNGTVNGATYTASGKINGAYSFDSSNDYIVSASNFTLTTNATYAFWINVPASWSKPYPTALSIREGADVANFDIIVRHRDVSNKVHFQHFNGTSWFSCNSATALSAGWHFIVATYEAGVTNGMKVYVDGSLSGQANSHSNLSVTGLLNIGRNKTASSDIYLNGILDEVGIWSRALTSDEITKLYNNGNGLTYQAVNRPGSGAAPN